jgi:hypothetical protein
MVRYLVTVLLTAICVAFLGCANVEPPMQVRAPAVAGPVEETSEPSDTSVQELAQPSAPHASQEPAPTAGEMPEASSGADSGPIEVNEPPVQGEDAPDLNAPAVEEPNDVVAEPEVQAEAAEPAVQKPDDVEPAAGRPDSTSFHDQYAEVLAAYVRENGLVDYGGLRRRRLELKPVLTALAELDPNVYQGWSRQEKLAFWINAYNLKMLEIIARNYPIESSWWLRLTWSPSDIRHIKGIWTDYRFIVMDEEFTLAEVEQRYFHKTFDDPRVWLALLYAGQSGPPLRVRPYRGEDLDRRLDEQVRRFLSSPQGLQIDRRNMAVRLSALFKPNWRGREFVGRYGTDKKFKAHDPATRAVLNFLTNYLPREDVDFLEVENYSLEYLNFDWRLNDTDKGY